MIRLRTTPCVLVAALLLGACGALRSPKPASSSAPSVADDLITLPSTPTVYKIDGAGWLQQGTAVTWLRFRSGPAAAQRRDHLVFATDDSRIVMVVDTFTSRSWPRPVVRIAARAGGNQMDKSRSFSEASILIDNDHSLPARPDLAHLGIRPFADDQWHCVAMSWRGYPAGEVAIYLNGEKVAVRRYDGQANSPQPPAESLAVAMRPDAWPGERRSLPNGAVIELVPRGDMALSGGGIDMRELHLLSRAADDTEILRIMAATRPATAH
jgi:hypothetical protein